nr:hypothetical protein [Cassava Torrado-like virus]
MSFIDSLDISEEETRFNKALNTKFDWFADCSVSNSLSGSTPTCSFIAVNKDTLKSSTIISLEWTHSTPQLVGHTILNGRWSVKDVKISGILVEATNRLSAVRSVIGPFLRRLQEKPKAPSSESSTSSLKEAEQAVKIQQLQTQLLTLINENKRLEGEIPLLKDQLQISEAENTKLKNKLATAELEFSRLRDKFGDKNKRPIVEEDSPPNPNNVSIFAQWAQTPEAE